MFHVATGVTGPTQGRDSGWRRPGAKQEGTVRAADLAQ